jgi:hypothetical protein
LPQGTISVSLLARYTGQLSIDRQLIPDDQIEKQSLTTFVFRPGAGKDIREFSPGAHNATFEAWPDTLVYEEAKAGRKISPYTWRFNVG